MLLSCKSFVVFDTEVYMKQKHVIELLHSGTVVPLTSVDAC